MKRVCVLSEKSELGVFQRGSDGYLLMPVCVHGYTVLEDEKVSALVLGVSIRTESELKEVLCGFLGYESVREGLQCTYAESNENVEGILRMYEKTRSMPAESDWACIMKYIAHAE
ncbi:uncharacterized protein NEMAJ01_1854 [Nematocida major]|uniref:uncharacterized protein n=1 Tax=Nematocida major TaxID=1912982 RepID=UPI002007FDE1|nr:uncharacterized protein NEMAJ01_1854 [Nematocida major]KAH9386958.1 hypothetical protein NEMAJ01_1854 [Nematocida major]